MINYGCFCHLNICLNLKLSKEEVQSLNTQIFGKCVCWKKVKVKALEKVEPHLNQCSRVPVYTQEFSLSSVLFQSKLQTRHGRPLFARSYKKVEAASL